MNEAAKQLTGSTTCAMGLVGNITLSGINEYAGLICAIVGIIAGICTIQSWWKNRK